MDASTTGIWATHLTSLFWLTQIASIPKVTLFFDSQIFRRSATRLVVSRESMLSILMVSVRVAAVASPQTYDSAWYFGNSHVGAFDLPQTWKVKSVDGRSSSNRIDWLSECVNNMVAYCESLSTDSQ
jgi:hypothetical protein